jgi:predicted enzyme related to lactoylglutathione lyase
MGEYEDFSMNDAESGSPVTGICHARGINADIPAQWLVYITVENLDESLLQCVNRGGAVLGEVRALGGSGRFCVIQDPAGAVAALFEPS